MLNEESKEEEEFLKNTEPLKNELAETLSSNAIEWGGSDLSVHNKGEMLFTDNEDILHEDNFNIHASSIGGNPADFEKDPFFLLANAEASATLGTDNGFKVSGTVGSGSLQQNLSQGWNSNMPSQFSQGNLTAYNQGYGYNPQQSSMQGSFNNPYSQGYNQLNPYNKNFNNPTQWGGGNQAQFGGNFGQFGGNFSNPMMQQGQLGNVNDPFQMLNPSDFYKEVQQSYAYLNNIQAEAEIMQMGGSDEVHKYIDKADKNYLTRLNEKLFDIQKNRQKVSQDEKEEVNAKLDYLTMKLSADLRKYRAYEGKSGKWSLFFELLSAILAATVTLLLGMDVTSTMKGWGLDWYVKFLALLISACITIINVFKRFFDPTQLYAKYIDTANRIEEMMNAVEYLRLGGDYVNLKDVNAIKFEHDRIIESTHSFELDVKAEDESVATKIKQQSRAKFGP